VALRLLADTLMLQVAVAAASLARFVVFVNVNHRNESPTRYDEVYSSYVVSYRNSAVPLTLVCLAVFYKCGFYTRGRAYAGRYKALVVAQGVSLGFLIFGMSSYFIYQTLSLPRATWALGWAFSVGLLVGSRLFSQAWSDEIRARPPSAAPADRKIRRVLVIGGAGYVGSALVPKLLAKGHHVRVLDLLLFGDEPLAAVLGHPRLEIIRADFRQVDQVVKAMHGVDAVIHLGAIVGDPACALDEELTVEVNLMATRMIAEVAKGQGNVNRFIFASTCSVYGASDEILDERSALAPVSLYARSKIASERVLLSMADEAFAPVILRFGTIYGLSGRTRFDLVVNLLTAKAVVDGEITVQGSDQWRPFLHVDDAALAVSLALSAPQAVVAQAVLNVGSDEQNYTIGEAGALISRLVPTAELKDLGPDGDRRNYRVDFTEIRRRLDFTPRWSLEAGIRQVLEAFENRTVTDYRHPMYSNVKFLAEDEAASRLAGTERNWAELLLGSVWEQPGPATVEEPATPLARTPENDLVIDLTMIEDDLVIDLTMIEDDLVIDLTTIEAGLTEAAARPS
jgi:nucleoside-diphosphate-sugar epimerase